MLTGLHIRNIALIKQLDLEFSAGLNVLSGETGAGKSIIVDSINFVLGAKTDRTLIRHGEQQAKAEAVFDLNAGQKERLIALDLGLDIEEDVFILARSMSDSGKSECRINGKVVTAATLKSAAAELVDLHGQHEHQSLLNPSNHLRILDGFIDQEAYIKTASDVAALYQRLCVLKKDIAKLGGNAGERTRSLDLLQYQISEIEKAEISEAEEKELTEKRNRLAHTEKILSSVRHCLDLIGGDSGAVESAGYACSALLPASRYDPAAEEIYTRLNSVSIELEDIKDSLAGILESSDFDADAGEKVERRLETYSLLKRKYGGSVEAVGEYHEKIKTEYDRLFNAEESLAKLEKELMRAKSDYMRAAGELSSLRRKAAIGLESAVITELSDLGMGGCVFKLEFSHYPASEEAEQCMTAKGLDRAEFYLSANKGEPPKPLSRIISGGEMSRLMLALKVVSGRTDNIETMIFDEIDTGISGKIGQAISEKMAKIAVRGQVLCVTHLAQIAAMADSQYLIEKSEVGGKTLTSVKPLDYKGMIDEISRLSGGKDISVYAGKQAQEMKEWSDSFKKGLV